MPMQILKNGRWRPARGGRLKPPPAPARLSPQALRRKQLSDAKNHAQEKMPKLDSLIDKFAEMLRVNAKTTDRYYYVPVLDEIYQTAWRWKEEKLEKRASTIAALQGEKIRKNETTLNVFVKAVCKRASINSKTASRWAGQLNNASNENVQPSAIDEHLRSN